jgi:hypothetical protein
MQALCDAREALRAVAVLHIQAAWSRYLTRTRLAAAAAAYTRPGRRLFTQKKAVFSLLQVQTPACYVVHIRMGGPCEGGGLEW